LDDIIARYAEAWNTPDAARRSELLEEALSVDCELIEPRGSFNGRDSIIERIEGFSARFPGARVDLTTNVDEHNGFTRYGWRIVDRHGEALLDGIDVVERAAYVYRLRPPGTEPQAAAIAVAALRERTVTAAVDRPAASCPRPASSPFSGDAFQGATEWGPRQRPGYTAGSCLGHSP
jgi:hypothetical protein